MKHFMLDIETMGLDPSSDDIIQIGILELTEINGQYVPGKEFCRTLFTSQKPKNDWIATNHKALLEKCRKVPMATPAQVRTDIRNFFAECVEEGPACLVGLNLWSLDLPFLLHKGHLKKEDFHYRVYEMRGSLNMVKDALQVDEKRLYELAEQACPEIELPEGKKHEALYDCYRQTKVLNGLIRLVRKAV